MPDKLSQLDRIEVKSSSDLEKWLADNHRQRDSVWLVTWKKSTGRNYVPRIEIVEALLAYGWIDSVPRKLDDKKTMRLISPRKAGSGWSRINKELVASLLASGRMRPAGLEAVENAKADGSWSRLDEIEALEVPADLLAALNAEPSAREHFDKFPPSSRRAILEWIANAKRSATREKRIAETARKASLNLKANHPKGRDRGPEPGK